VGQIPRWYVAQLEVKKKSSSKNKDLKSVNKKSWSNRPRMPGSPESLAL